MNENDAFYQQGIEGAVIKIEGPREVVTQIVEQMPTFQIVKKVPNFKIERIEYKD